MSAVIPVLIGLAIVVALWPAAIWAVSFAKRHRGAAVLATSVLLAFGMNYQVTPPPPSQTEYVQRQAAKAPDDEPKDGPRSSRCAPPPEGLLCKIDAPAPVAIPKTCSPIELTGASPHHASDSRTLGQWR